MAFPSVSAADTQSGSQSSNSTSWTLTYPTNLANGDLIIAFMARDGGASTGTWPAGWVAASQNGFASTESLTMAKKVSDGTETGNFSVTGLSSEQGVWRVIRITGWEGTLGTTFTSDTANNGSVTRSASGNQDGTAPDAPVLDPTNWGAEDTLWIAVGFSDHGDTTYTGFPANYTQEDHTTAGGHAQESGGAGGAGMGIAYRKLNASSENPGAFTSDTEQSGAITFAIRPAAAAAPTAFAQAQTRIKATYRGYAQAQAQVGTTIIYDTFTDVTSTSLESHVPDIKPTGSVYYGFTTGDIFVNAVDKAEATSAFHGAYIDSGVSDGTFTGILESFSESIDTRLELHFRAEDVDEWGNKWTVFLYRGADGSFRSMGLTESTGGTGTDYIDTDPGPVSAAGPHEIKAIFQGTSISIYLNGVQVGTTITNSTHLTAQNVGIGFANGGDGTIDDIRLISKVGTKQHSQAQARIKAIGVKGFAQAQANIKAISRGYAQAQTDIKTTYRGFAQAQANIKQTYYAHAQAQAQIKNTYYGLAQAQARLKNIATNFSNPYAQSQADIKTTYRVHAQAQAEIQEGIVARNGHSQAQANIKQTYQIFAQAQTDIKATSRAFGQAQATIFVRIFYDTFTRTVGDGFGTNDGYTYIRRVGGFSDDGTATWSVGGTHGSVDSTESTSAARRIEIKWDEWAVHKGIIQFDFRIPENVGANISLQGFIFMASASDILAIEIVDEAPTVIMQAYPFDALVNPAVVDPFEYNTWYTAKLFVTDQPSQPMHVKVWKTSLLEPGWMESGNSAGTTSYATRANFSIDAPEVEVPDFVTAVEIDNVAIFNAFSAVRSYPASQAQALIYTAQTLSPIADITTNDWLGVVI